MASDYFDAEWMAQRQKESVQGNYMVNEDTTKELIWGRRRDALRPNELVLLEQIEAEYANRGGDFPVSSFLVPAKDLFSLLEDLAEARIGRD
jgi:hypothetical protein